MFNFIYGNFHHVHAFSAFLISLLSKEEKKKNANNMNIGEWRSSKWWESSNVKYYKALRTFQTKQFRLEKISLTI